MTNYRAVRAAGRRVPVDHGLTTGFSLAFSLLLAGARRRRARGGRRGAAVDPRCCSASRARWRSSGSCMTVISLTHFFIIPTMCMALSTLVLRAGGGQAVRHRLGTDVAHGLGALECQFAHAPQIDLAGAERRDRLDRHQDVAPRQPQPRQVGARFRRPTARPGATSGRV